MASALDTLCGQSYGAKQYQNLGIHMQRAMVVLTVVSIPVAVIWANTRFILVFLGQDPEISAAAEEYAKLMVPSLFGFGLLQCLNRFLQTQNIVFPMMLSSGVATLLHILICWIMVFKSGLGLNTTTSVVMIPFGLGAAVSTRVSNELGAGHPRAARLAVRVVSVLAIVEGILVATVLILIRNIWGYAYSNEVEVVKYVATMMPILATSHFLDAIQSVLSGTARGCGLQKIGAFVNLGSYYLVGIPSSIVLAFVLHLGGKGLWLGIICALIVQLLSLVIITIRTVWEKQAKKATDRIYDSITPESLTS